jgi:hypothetical protein
MSWGVSARTGIALGLGNIVAFFTVRTGAAPSSDNLLAESGDNLVQEDGSFILV